jgi:hypothetical protein
MASLDKEQVIEKFTNAYQSANGKAPELEAKSGWYSVDGGKKMRLAQLDELADELASGGAAEKAPEAPKAAPKAAKAAPKAKAKKAAPKKEKSGFSVKEFWNDKILSENSGAIKPR